MASSLDCKLNRVGDQACIVQQPLSGPSTEPGIQSEVRGGGEREKEVRETPTKEHQQRREDEGEEKFMTHLLDNRMNSGFKGQTTW